MESNKDKKDADVYRAGKLTILELMAVLAILGILVTWVLHSFFGG
jgi:prepilin-type N-terminal cleavage/methylation domain-containing protein